MRASPAAAAYVLLPTRTYLDALSLSSNARVKVKALGGHAAVKERQNVLAMHILQFGKYQGQTLKAVGERPRLGDRHSRSVRVQGQ